MESRKNTIKKSSIADFIETLQQFFDKFPALPKHWREILVKIVPYFCLIIGILGLLNELNNIRFLFQEFYGMGILTMICSTISYVLLLIAYPGTKAKNYKGWTFLFWSDVASTLGALLSFTSILSVVIVALIEFYLIFQIRKYYK